jgi:hypothetical protein
MQLPQQILQDYNTDKYALASDTYWLLANFSGEWAIYPVNLYLNNFGVLFVCKCVKDCNDGPGF